MSPVFFVDFEFVIKHPSMHCFTLIHSALHSFFVYVTTTRCWPWTRNPAWVHSILSKDPDAPPSNSHTMWGCYPALPDLSGPFTTKRGSAVIVPSAQQHPGSPDPVDSAQQLHLDLDWRGSARDSPPLLLGRTVKVTMMIREEPGLCAL